MSPGEVLRTYHLSDLTFYGRVQESLSPHLFQHISNVMIQKKQPSILDVGCSAGLSTQDLKMLFSPHGMVVGIDLELRRRLKRAALYRKLKTKYFSPAALAQPVTLIEADAYDMPFASDSFDMVAAVNNFLISIIKHHIGPDFMIQIVNQFINVAKTNGILFFGYSETGRAAIVLQLDDRKKIRSIQSSFDVENTPSSKLVFDQLIFKLHQSFL